MHFSSVGSVKAASEIRWLVDCASYAPLVGRLGSDFPGKNQGGIPSVTPPRHLAERQISR